MNQLVTPSGSNARALAAEIEPPPSFGALIRADFIAGMGKVAGRFVILLDIQRVLSTDEMAALSSVGGQSAADGGVLASH